MSDTFIVLANPPFNFEWNGKVYEVKKATLSQIAAFTARSKQLIDEKDPAAEQKLVAYCISLVLKSQDPTITEEVVMDNTPGDINFMDVFTSLGFMSPAKFQAALEAANLSTTESSGPTSPTEQDGPQDKSPS